MTGRVTDAVACLHQMSSDLAQPRLPILSAIYYKLYTNPHQEQADWTRSECLCHTLGVVLTMLSQLSSQGVASNWRVLGIVL